MRKVAIVGKAATAAFAPFQDEGWEIWGMPWVGMPRASRLFDMHSQARMDESPLGADAARWIAKLRDLYRGVPVYCEPTRMHAFETAVEYPLQAVMEFLPIPFLENTVAYQIALALCEGVDVIGLYGVHLIASGEYAFERPSVTYLVGLAQGRGVKVEIAPGSPLFISDFNAGRYGQAGTRRFS
jgi:hypothetical protein